MVGGRYQFILVVVASDLVAKSSALIVTTEGGVVSPAQKFEHVPASFGLTSSGFPQEVVAAKLQLAEPVYGCSLGASSKHVFPECQNGGDDFVLLISRGGCNFTEKVLWAQASCAAGAVVFDDAARGHVSWGVIMTEEGTAQAELSQSIKIPSVFVSFETGATLITVLTAVGRHSPSSGSTPHKTAPLGTCWNGSLCADERAVWETSESKAGSGYVDSRVDRCGKRESGDSGENSTAVAGSSCAAGGLSSSPTADCVMPACSEDEQEESFSSPSTCSSRQAAVLVTINSEGNISRFTSDLRALSLKEVLFLLLVSSAVLAGGLTVWGGVALLLRWSDQRRRRCALLRLETIVYFRAEEVEEDNTQTATTSATTSAKAAAAAISISTAAASAAANSTAAASTTAAASVVSDCVVSERVVTASCGRRDSLANNGECSNSSSSSSSSSSDDDNDSSLSGQLRGEGEGGDTNGPGSGRRESEKSGPEGAANWGCARDQSVAGQRCCAVCLEEYENGDVVKVLPCFHCFHGESHDEDDDACIIPWLQHRSIECPLCKQVVESLRPRWNFASGYDNDSEGGRHDGGRIPFSSPEYWSAENDDQESGVEEEEEEPVLIVLEEKKEAAPIIEAGTEKKKREQQHEKDKKHTDAKEDESDDGVDSAGAEDGDSRCLKPRPSRRPKKRGTSKKRGRLAKSPSPQPAVSPAADTTANTAPPLLRPPWWEWSD